MKVSEGFCHRTTDVTNNISDSSILLNWKCNSSIRNVIKVCEVESLLKAFFNITPYTTTKCSIKM